MRYDLYTAPTVEPVTVADIEAWAQIGSAQHDQDGTIQTMITAARQIVERRLRRQLITATWKLYLDDFPAEILITDHLPVTAITSITYVDTAGATQTLSATYYQTDYASEDSPARIWEAYGYSWPTCRGDTVNQVCVTFTAGYGTPSQVPSGIKAAIAQIVASMFRDRESSIVGTINSPSPWAVDAVLAHFDTGIYS